MAQIGMDVDEVERLGYQMRDTLAPKITDVMNEINRLVGQMQANWWGKDAQTFCNDWWPQHQRQLQEAFTAIHGLGQSALNNATEQRNISNP